MVRFSTLAACVLALVLTAPAHAQETPPAVAAPQTWIGPDPERRGYMLGHAQENFETAITEICFPFIFQNAEANSWTRQPRAGISRYPAGPGFQGLSVYLVGGSSGSIVGVGNRGPGRECTLKPDDRVDPEETLLTLRALIARMPVAMTESAQPFSAGQFAQRITWCGSADAPNFAVLASVNHADRPRGQPALFVTFVETPARDRRCDPPPS